MTSFAREIIELAGPSLVSDKEKIDWKGVERRVGTMLPEDYKALNSEYFAVNLGPFSVGTPRRGAPGCADPLEATMEAEEIFKEVYLDEPEEVSEAYKADGTPLGSRPEVPKFYPSVPGLLKWGMDQIGGQFYWYVDGPPELWTVVAQARDGWWDEHDMSMSEYMYRVIKGSVQCTVVEKVNVVGPLLRE
ncbi:hypothetical protein [Nocardiopsis synnemataformans]|uniref:hypothetical protein n=1 Tax=Nocardiopsis synnemataformans TaxID=61305 RepID=UPI003EBAB7F5